MNCGVYADRALKTGINIQPVGTDALRDCGTQFGTSCGDFDLVVADGRISKGDLVQALVVTHLDTAAPDLEVSCSAVAQGGWWADKWRPDNKVAFGSRLWKLRTAKPSNETLAMAIFYAKESLNKLAPFISGSFEVTGEMVNRRTIVLHVKVTGPSINVVVGYSGSYENEWVWGIK